MQFALYYTRDAFDTAARLMGRQSAGFSFLRAAVNAGPERLWCYASSLTEAQSLAGQVRDWSSGPLEVRWIPLHEPERLAQAGLLYRPDPAIGQDAWRRQARGAGEAYSLCGITHTIASQSAMQALTDLLVAPMQPWDAVICTSRAARDSVRTILEAQAEHLRERLGATIVPMPHLPVIPLGVHAMDFETFGERRAAARAELGIAEAEVVFLFVGRLSFHAKAHPLPMYLALEKAAQGRRVALIQFGQFGSAGIERAFRSEAQAFAPSVRALFIDGREEMGPALAWGAADVFTSLADNHQETFGLTPLEAMAAGLPVVVSDWDGYRDTVRDGIDGFRLPTLTVAPGTGGDLADRYDVGLDNYDFYVGHTSQLIAVDVDAAAAAYRRLIDDPELRRRLGQAGRERARSAFDWRVIFGRYAALWDELAERRVDPWLQPAARPSRRPDRADPFTFFASYPTRALGDDVAFRLRAGVTIEDALARRELESVRFAIAVLPSAELIELVVRALDRNTWASMAEVAIKNPVEPKPALERALLWLAKVGIVAFRLRPRGRP